MEEEKLREAEAAEAETVRKLAAAQQAAARASELQFLSPSLRTYVTANPDADIATLRYMEEQRIKDNLAAQEMRQQLDALREQVTQMRQRPTSQGAAFDALIASSKANEKLAKAVGNSINRSNSVTSKAPESLIRFVQECPLDDKADFGYQIEEMLRSMFDIHAAEQMLRSESFTDAEYGIACWKMIKKDFVAQVKADILTTADKAKETFFDGTSAYYLTDEGRELLQRVISKETSALDMNGVRKWTKHPNAPGNESELRESYLFPNKPSYVVHRLIIAKCILYMWYLKDNQNRPYANELIAAVESPGINGGVLTFVLDCIRSASPGSTEIFGRRLLVIQSQV